MSLFRHPDLRCKAAQLRHKASKETRGQQPTDTMHHARSLREEQDAGRFDEKRGYCASSVHSGLPVGVVPDATDG